MTLDSVAEPDLWSDFLAVCDCGGRLAGTDSEARALALMKARGQAASGVALRIVPVPYGGWTTLSSSLRIGDEILPCCPLVRSVATPPGGVTAEVVDLGRGTPEDFEAHAGDLPGRFALVRHELMFASGTIHRRRKYEMARAAGAVGFLIAGPLQGGPVAGSSGRAGADGIPSAGIAPKTAALLRRRASGWPSATLAIETREAPAATETLIFDMPGATDEWVVLSAHVDGHDLAESAIDNATGLAAALAVTRALAPGAKCRRRGLRLAIFSVEEWALTGSAQYVAGLSPGERSAITLNVNLDSIAGSSSLAALTSGFSAIEPFLLDVSERVGTPLRIVRPPMANSDHANFAAAGIPAFRLVAGFDEPDAATRLVLTPADTRQLVRRADLERATSLALAIVEAACDVPSLVSPR